MSSVIFFTIGNAVQLRGFIQDPRRVQGEPEGFLVELHSGIWPIAAGMDNIFGKEKFEALSDGIRRHWHGGAEECDGKVLQGSSSMLPGWVGALPIGNGVTSNRYTKTLTGVTLTLHPSTPEMHRCL